MMEHIVEEYWQRYRKPMIVAETAGRGTVKRRMKWLQDSVVATKNLRSRGVPLVGYTWWPMFDLIAWAYRQGRGPLGAYVVPMGLWSLNRETLDRVHTPLVDAFRELAAQDSATAGKLSVSPVDAAISAT
jgi:beta-glucosidase/6-phospho-beta-glucosidase/beta-galactosidase